jgi:predicted dehydrogenase
VKLLIVGAGSIGRRHARSAAQLGLTFSVMDIDAARAAVVAAETSAQRHFIELKTALAWGADGVIVATPHVLHLAQAEAALDAGAHVLIEKPISDRLEGIDRLIDIAEAANLGLYVGCNMRFHPAIEAIRSNIGRIGEVRYARAHYGNFLPLMRPGADYRQLYCASRAAGGGVILDAIHEIDYLMWLLGPVKAVQGASAKLSDLDIDVEDFADIVLEHDAGPRSVITIDYLRPWKRRGCEVIGSDGLIVWESEGKAPEQCRIRLYDSGRGAWETLLETDDLDNGRPFVDMLRAFTRATRGERTCLQTAREGKQRLAVGLQARRDHMQELASAV